MEVARVATYLTPTTESDPVFYNFFNFCNDYALKNQKLNMKPCKKMTSLPFVGVKYTGGVATLRWPYFNITLAGLTVMPRRIM